MNQLQDVPAPPAHPDWPLVRAAFASGDMPPEVLADWLEDRGDPRAAQVRAQEVRRDYAGACLFFHVWDKSRPPLVPRRLDARECGALRRAWEAMHCGLTHVEPVILQDGSAIKTHLTEARAHAELRRRVLALLGERQPPDRPPAVATAAGEDDAHGRVAALIRGAAVAPPRIPAPPI